MYVLFHHGGEQEGSPQNCVYANFFDPLIVSHDMKHSFANKPFDQQLPNLYHWVLALSFVIAFPPTWKSNKTRPQQVPRLQ